jgi:hypothetical protein
MEPQLNYVVVYEITTQPPFSTEWELLSAGVFIVGLVWQILRVRRDKKKIPPPERPRLTTPKVLMGFATIMAIVGVGLMGWDHQRLVRAWEAGEAQVVEGPIQSWSTERQRTSRRDKYEYHTYESFYIGDSIWFGYRWEVGQAGFHNAADPPIALSNGRMARATYLYADGQDDPPRIVKLELAIPFVLPK